MTAAAALPAEHHLRAPTPDELLAVAQVLIADQVASGGQSTLGADYIAKVWAGPGFVLATDAWVVTDADGRIVGYGQVTRDAPDILASWGVVDPASRGQGIGSAIFDQIEARAAELLQGIDTARLRHAVDANDAAAADMLRARGLRPVRHFWHMEIDLAAPSEAAPLPSGIEIIEVDAYQQRAVHAVMQEAFADDWGYHPEPFDEWLNEQSASPRYDPTLWALAMHDAQPAGALTASAAADGGWIDELAVLSRYRGRGIGSVLLRRAFAALAARGLRRAMLNVDAENPTGATALYERVGMRVADRWDLWERPEGEARPPSGA